MNRVDKIAFHLSGEEESFFRDLHADFDHKWSYLIECVTEKVLDKWDNPTMVIEVKELILELPPIPEEKWNHAFIELYEEALEEALQRTLKTDANQQKAFAVKSDKKALLFHYLLHGQLLWRPGGSAFNFQALFLEIIRTNASELYHFLRTYGHYASLQERLIYQLDDKGLEKGIQLLNTSEAPFIIAYVKHIKLKLKKINQPKIAASNYEKIVWKVVYSYLLTTNTSFFQKKMFVKYTLTQLAHQYNLNYAHLLRLITVADREVHHATEFDKIREELYLEEQNTVVKRKDWKQWIDFLVHMQGSLMEGITSDKWNLIQLLKGENSGFLLEQLTEKEIFQLIGFLIPSEKKFVIETVQSVEVVQSKGQLEGQTGGEFRILKWRILFPILLQNNGSGFNRKYFVERLLVQLAAHYNVTVWHLLTLIDVTERSFIRDTELIKIWTELTSRYTPKTDLIGDVQPFNKERLLLAIKSKERLTALQMRELNKWMDNSVKSIRLFENLRVSHLQGFIKLNYRKDESWIIHYANYLDMLATHQEITIKTGSPIQEMKWYFFFQVLFSSKGQLFNKEYLVHQVIHKIVAHYNLKEELVLLLLTDKLAQKGSVLPYDLFQIILRLKTRIQSTKELNEKHSDDRLNTAESVAEVRIQSVKWKDERSFLQDLKHHKVKAFIAPVWQEFSTLFELLNSLVSIKREKIADWHHVYQFYHKSNSLSQVEWLRQIVSWMIAQLGQQEQRRSFIKLIAPTAQSGGLLQTIVEDLQDVTPDKEEKRVASIEPMTGYLDVPGAGVILIAVYLPRLFSILGYLEEGKFMDEEKQIRAVFIIQYLAFGCIEFEEYELLLAKMLVGLELDRPVPKSMELTEIEMQTGEQLLRAVLQHWVKVTTVEGLREGFLQREGILHLQTEKNELTVVPKSYDMLLDSIEWSYKTTKFSWMEKSIITNWR